MDPGLVIVIVVVGVIIASGLVYRSIGGTLGRWRTEASAPFAEQEGPDDLRDEVRSLVVAANERRERRGEPPLDVDAEVERRLREFDQ